MKYNYVEDSRECEILINTTHMCNLRCKYCFVTDGLNNFEGGNVPELMMDRNIQEACLDFLKDYCRSFDKITLHFYGGEPFIHFDAMRYITERAQSVLNHNGNIHFAVTTNGTLINRQIAEFLDSFRFAVLVSFDGVPEVHDKMRLTSDGKPTSHKVLETIHMLKAYENIRLGLSAVIHKENRLISAYDILTSLSPDFIKAEYVRMISGHHLGLDEDDKKIYFEDLSKIADHFIKQLLDEQIPNDYRFNSRVLQMWRGSKRKEFCGAGSSILGIASNGDIFPCTLLIGNDDCCLGNVSYGIKPDAVRQFKNWHRFTGKDSCRNCNVRYYCGGGCAAMWKTAGIGFCEYIKKEIYLAEYIYKYIAEVKPEAFALLVSNEFYERLKTTLHSLDYHDETI